MTPFIYHNIITFVTQSFSNYMTVILPLRKSLYYISHI